MKKLSIILIIFLITFQSFGQQLSMVDLINSLMQVESIKKYKVFKNNYENLLVDTTSNEKLINNRELYNELKAVYNSTIKEYDGFLVQIKSDMTNFNAIKEMTNNPKKYAQKYMTTFLKAKVFDLFNVAYAFY